MSNLSATHRVDDIAQARVALVMGSNSDWPVMRQAAEVFEHFGIPYWAQVVSAHRMPHQMVEFGQTATEHGWAGIVAGAGGAAHLPGMLAALTEVPVFGVPIPTRHMNGEDSLWSIVQMPKGVPVATFAIGEAGAVNAALHLVANLAVHDPALKRAWHAYRAAQTQKAAAMRLE
ncbi:MAG TPA: 5-(carboxyamino)imidazole ribonucleotide mutase [Paenalcaligenes sp.]|nr:5-(carboxyamino)imidazole ribonucleotide mutase [Paenalcaligenes sp.]